MNSHLSKPFKPVDLYNKIIELTGPSEHSAGSQSVDDTSEIKPSLYKGEFIDLTETLEMVGGSVDVLNDLIREFLTAVPSSVSEIKECLRENDFRSAARIAHKIKPAFYYMGMIDSHEKIQELENAAKSEISQEFCLNLANVIQNQIEKVRAELEGFLGSSV